MIILKKLTCIMIRCKREEKFILFSVIFWCKTVKPWSVCHYSCDVVTSLKKSHGIDEISVLPITNYNLHTTIRYKQSISVINPVYKYTGWRKVT
jgi:hypothetical protein